MFAALRQNLTTAWKRLRQGNLAKLFVFEFTVVVLGVLVAQGLANYFGERAEARRVEAIVGEIETELGDAATVFEDLLVHAPCFRTHLRQVMASARDGEAVDPARLPRPSMRLIENSPVPAAAIADIARYEGEQKAQAMTSMSVIARGFENRLVQFGDEWRPIAVIDPRNGQPNAADYERARVAAAQVLGTLDSMVASAASGLAVADTLELDRTSVYGGRRATCEEIWAYGTTHFFKSELDADGAILLPRVDSR